MAEYKSAYTGEQIDAGIGKANTAVQPADLSAYQELLVSGTNIKTINNTSLLGEGNIDIQGGGGEGASIRVVDATNPDDWSGEEPTQSCLLDIVSNEYQIIYITNIPADVEGMEYAIAMRLNAKVDNNESGSEQHMRQYLRFDNDDEEESAYIQGFTFSKEGDDEATMSVDEYPLGGGGSGSDAPIIFQPFASYVDGNTGKTKIIIYNNQLEEITNAIDNYKEVVIRVDGANYDDNKYFRLSDFDKNGKTYIEAWDKNLYFPNFICETPYGQYFIELDHLETSESYALYSVVEGTKRYQPTDIKFSTNMIQFDSDDLTQIWTQKRPEITVNVDESSGEQWVAFKKVSEDLTQGAEKFIYSSNIIPDSSHLFYYQIILNMNNGDIETSIYKYEISASSV